MTEEEEVDEMMVEQVYYEQIGKVVLLYRNVVTGSFTIYDKKPYSLRIGQFDNNDTSKRIGKYFANKVREKENDTTKTTTITKTNESIRENFINTILDHSEQRLIRSSVYEFIKGTASLYRTCSRWYYPMDCYTIGIYDHPIEQQQQQVQKQVQHGSVNNNNINIDTNNVQVTDKLGTLTSSSSSSSSSSVSSDDTKEFLKKCTFEQDTAVVLVPTTGTEVDENDEHKIKDNYNTGVGSHQLPYDVTTTTCNNVDDTSTINNHTEQSNHEENRVNDHNVTTITTTTNNKNNNNDTDRYDEIDMIIDNALGGDMIFDPTRSLQHRFSSKTYDNNNMVFDYNTLIERRRQMLYGSIHLNHQFVQTTRECQYQLKRANNTWTDYNSIGTNSYVRGKKRRHPNNKNKVKSKTNTQQRNQSQNQQLSVNGTNNDSICDDENDSSNDSHCDDNDDNDNQDEDDDDDNDDGGYKIRRWQIDQIAMYERDRIDRSDAASYLAPFGNVTDLLNITLDDACLIKLSQEKKFGSTKRKLYKKSYLLGGNPVHLKNYINLPSKYGNCIIVVPCQCKYCCNVRYSNNGKLLRHDQSKLCLLHPIGPLMDIIKVSYLNLSRDVPYNESQKTPYPNSNKLFNRDGSNMDQLNVGHTIRQLTQGGSNDMFIARTDINIIIFQINFLNRIIDDDSNQQLIGCYKLVEVVQLYCIDLRKSRSSISIASYSMQSLFPIDVTSHPKYGTTNYIDSKGAIVYQSSTTKECNHIHHIAFNENTMHITGRHHIRNLQSISCLNFSANHPMVLWSASTSYIRPTLTSNTIHRVPRIGHGKSLYSIDLRTDTGTFQWSPSHDDYMVDCIHTISGIETDWDRDNTIWVSSISAGKTWEIDTRMPCTVVTQWSLPHAACDPYWSGELNNNNINIYGDGTIFIKPQIYQGYTNPIPGDNTFTTTTSSLSTPPSLTNIILSVGKSVSTHGIHIYYRPRFRQSIPIRPVECVAQSTLAQQQQQSTLASSIASFAATSSILPLPDNISNDVFTCGLSSFQYPLGRMGLEKDDDGDDGNGNGDDEEVNGIVVLTMTNHGDLYTHTLAPQTFSTKSPKTSESINDPGLNISLSCSIPVQNRKLDQRNCLTNNPKAIHLPLRNNNDADDDDGDDLSMTSLSSSNCVKSSVLAGNKTSPTQHLELRKDLTTTATSTRFMDTMFGPDTKLSSITKDYQQTSTRRSDINPNLIIQSWPTTIDKDSNF